MDYAMMQELLCACSYAFIRLWRKHKTKAATYRGFEKVVFKEVARSSPRPPNR